MSTVTDPPVGNMLLASLHYWIMMHTLGNCLTETSALSELYISFLTFFLMHVLAVVQLYTPTQYHQFCKHTRQTRRITKYNLWPAAVNMFINTYFGNIQRSFGWNQ